MSQPEKKIHKLYCLVQNYHWGKYGRDSIVAQLAENHSVVIDEKKTYAEIWFGDHPSGPSRIIGSDGEATELLDVHYKKNLTQILGEKVSREFGALPFLLKVLSINSALSIQAHPNKSLAQELHKKHPQIYKDGNHKPEMALAITKMTALCQFRPHKEIVHFLESVPALRTVIGDSIVNNYIATVQNSTSSTNQLKDSLKSVYKGLMDAPQQIVEQNLTKLLEHLKGNDQSQFTKLVPWVQKAAAEYPGDVGVFCFFLLNLVELQPGEAVFLAADEPHAYLYGDCVECMATSDNVVRAGLTPKFKDISTLISMLTYNATTPQIYRGVEIPHQNSVIERNYIPPIPEFRICHVKVPKLVTHTILPFDGPSILVVYEGNGHATSNKTSLSVSRGSAIFIYSKTEFQITAEENLDVYIATSNL